MHGACVCVCVCSLLQPPGRDVLLPAVDAGSAAEDVGREGGQTGPGGAAQEV